MSLLYFICTKKTKRIRNSVLLLTFCALCCTEDALRSTPCSPSLRLLPGQTCGSRRTRLARKDGGRWRRQRCQAWNKNVIGAHFWKSEWREIIYNPFINSMDRLLLLLWRIQNFVHSLLVQVKVVERASSNRSVEVPIVPKAIPHSAKVKEGSENVAGLI